MVFRNGATQEVGDVRGDIRIIDMTTAHERFPEVRDFIYEILYAPFGIDYNGIWNAIEDGALFKGALDREDRIVGCARLVPTREDGAAVVRTVATSAKYRGLGLGRRLMHEIEREAHARGATHMWLNARVPALGFYENLGYRSTSDEFVNPPSGLLHRTMVKDLPPQALSA